MPLYDYYCAFCHKTHELLQKPTDPIVTACPSCHQQGLQKQVSSAAFQLKGTGWYVTDFKSKNNTEKETPKEAPKEAPAATTTTTETKKAEE